MSDAPTLDPDQPEESQAEPDALSQVVSGDPERPLTLEQQKEQARREAEDAAVAEDDDTA
jgi:hypothetical protein